MNVQKRLQWSAAVLGIIVAGSAAALQLFPAKILEAQERFKLWRGGVESIESVAGDHGWSYTPRECRAADAGCRCVVLVHGMADSALTWRKWLVERSWLGDAANRTRLLAWDLPGHGRTVEPVKTPDGELQLRASVMAQRLLGASQAAGCGAGAIWVGNSFGGWVAAWAGLKRPDLVSQLVLLAPAGLRSQQDVSVEKTMALVAPSIEALKNWQKEAYFGSVREYPDWIWRAAVDRIRATPVMRIRRAQQEDDWLDARLGQWRIPVQVFWGAEDRILPLTSSAGFSRLSDTTVVTKIDRCGHLVQKECAEPAREFIRAAVASVQR